MTESTTKLVDREVSRRSFLRYLYMGGAVASTSSLLAACGGSGGGSPEAGSSNASTTNPTSGPGVGGVELDIPSGPLSTIPPVQDVGMDNMQLPPGFSVRRVATSGLNPLSGQVDTNYNWHDAPDGGAVYVDESNGSWVYVSNAEIGSGGGGVGALHFAADGTLINAYPILTGTSRNCAGGQTPWGTWLSCEENGSSGEIYECEPFGTPADAVVKPVLGARNHEAAAIDPIHHVCYMTEDAGSGRFWRFVSSENDTFDDNGVTRMRFESGGLQVMNIEGFEDGGAPADSDMREARRVTWITPGTSGGFGGVGGTTAGTAFDGGEGIWYYEVPSEFSTIPTLGVDGTRGVVFFTTKGDNRVWAYDIENELVELIFDNTNNQISPDLNDVDNLTVSPKGDVIVAEDGSGMRLVVVVPNEPAKILMQITGNPSSEIVGPAFHPDGSKLYFSAQRGPTTGSPGVTYEVTIPPEYR